ncbi:hypothetical protein BJV74DRAFT_164556 [Russula compacta]|nr:hypothetical protein BJV74DRAFT_164556 [Russula compacta]
MSWENCKNPDEHPAKSSVIATSFVNGHARFTAVFSAPTLCWHRLKGCPHPDGSAQRTQPSASLPSRVFGGSKEQETHLTTHNLAHLVTLARVVITYSIRSGLRAPCSSKTADRHQSYKMAYRKINSQNQFRG